MFSAKVQCIIICSVFALIQAQPGGSQNSQPALKLIASKGAQPDPASREYITISEERSRDKKQFNAGKDPISRRSIVVIGHHIRISRNHPNGVFERLNEQSDIEKLSIEAEEVVIADRLHVPQTAVTIRAERLIFEGNGRMDTTPLAEWYSPDPATDNTPAGNGLPGHKGGDILLYIKKLTLPPKPDVPLKQQSARAISATNTGQLTVKDPQEYNAYISAVQQLDDKKKASDLKLFLQLYPNSILRDSAERELDDIKCDIETGDRLLVANGGSGQQPGSGRNGIDGSTMDTYPGTTDVVYRKYERREAWGTPKWPIDGTDAKPDGKPGNGGDAGNISSTVPIATDRYVAVGGCAGPRGVFRKRGESGIPTTAVQEFWAAKMKCSGNRDNLDCDYRWPEATHRESRVSRAGSSSPAPLADVPQGKPGHFLALPDTRAWWTVASAAKALDFAKDLYLQSYVNESGAILEHYDTILKSAEVKDETSSYILWQQRAELDTMLHRYRSGLDFFGHPAGYVPNLSLELNVESYRHELKYAIAALFTCYWLKIKDRDARDLQAATQFLLTQTKAELSESRSQFNQLQSQMGELQNKVAAAKQRRDAMLQVLQELQKRLAEQAQQNVQARQSNGQFFKSLLTLAKVVPIYQPALGSAAIALENVTNSSADPLSRIESLSTLADSVGAVDLQQLHADIRQHANNLDPAQSASVKDYLTGVRPSVEKMRAIEAAVVSSTQTPQVAQTEVEAEFERLKRANPEYQKDIALVEQYSAEQAAFAVELNRALQAVATLSDDISQKSLTILTINEALATIGDSLDARTSVYLDELERTERLRLLKYHYYIARAYEYRLMSPYPSDIKSDSDFQRLLRLASLDIDKNDPVKSVRPMTLNKEEYARLEVVYEKPLAVAAENIRDEINNGQVESDGFIKLTLSQKELDELNGSGILVTNLMNSGRFPSNETRQRIISISTCSIATDPQLRQADHRINITYQRRGSSYYNTGRARYVFRHAVRSWKSRTSFPVPANQCAQGGSTTDEVSASTKSLLDTLLEKPGNLSAVVPAAYFSRPSVDGDLFISKDSYPPLLKVTALTLRVDYEYSPLTTNMSSTTLTPFAPATFLRSTAVDEERVNVPDVEARCLYADRLYNDGEARWNSGKCQRCLKGEWISIQKTGCPTCGAVQSEGASAPADFETAKGIGMCKDSSGKRFSSFAVFRERGRCMDCGKDNKFTDTDAGYCGECDAPGRCGYLVVRVAGFSLCRPLLKISVTTGPR